ASGAHMSPVSPKPCNIITADPLPPTRTYMVALFVAILWILKSTGKRSMRAKAGDAQTTMADTKMEVRNIQTCRTAELVKFLEMFIAKTHNGQDSKIGKPPSWKKSKIELMPQDCAGPFPFTTAQ